MKPLRRLLAAILSALWAVSAFSAGTDDPITAIAGLTDRAKLATLKSERAANDRLLKCVAWLAEAKAAGRIPVEVIAEAQKRSGDSGARAALVRDALLRNLDIAEKLGCLTPENLALMKRGRSPQVTRGPYAGEPAEVDHVVPIAVMPELGNEIANLEMMPRTLNRRKGAKVGQRQLDYARRFMEAGVISREAYLRVTSPR